MARASSTPILEIVTGLGFAGVLAAAAVRGDFVVMIAVVVFLGLGYALYHSLKQDVLHPYVFRSEELTLEFLDADAHEARITTAGEVMANIEGWRVFESGQQLPEDGHIGEIGERYDGLRRGPCQHRPGVQ